MKRAPDYSYLAARRQLDALACDTYEVGVYERASDRMLLRTWGRDQVLKSMPWLKARNTDGQDIFIRPAGSVGLVFFDDLTRGALARMAEEGLQPTVVIESSPANFHGWVRAADEPIADDVATAAAKVLAKRYGGDADSADWRHFGRLAGFTNQKPKYRDEQGRAPFVKIESVKQGKAPAGVELLDAARALLVEREQERQARVERLKAVIPSQGLRDAAEFFLSELAGLIDRYGGGMDRSRADWMICVKMALRGYSSDQIKAVLYQQSLAAKNRAGHVEDYVERTVDNVFGVGRSSEEREV